MVNYNYLNNYRDNNINYVYLRRCNKLSVKKEEDLNDFFKNNIIKTISDNTKYSFLKKLIKVEKCNLLNCELNYNGTNIEFEDGNLVTSTDEINNDTNIEIIKELMETETKEIKEMLALPLTLNANIANLGYIMDIELVKVVSFYNENNIEKFSNFLVNELKAINDENSESDDNNSDDEDSDNKYIPTFQNFPKEHLESDAIYPSYCQWLNVLNHSSTYDNKDNIPKRYQSYLEKKNNENELDFLKNISVDENGETSLKVISLGSEEDYCQAMSELIQSSEAFTRKDVDDLKKFADNITDHANYIPHTFNNIENLGHIICNVLTHFRGEKPSYDTYLQWLSQFDKTFDNILMVILAFSDHVDIASDLYKYREFGYFNEHEEQLIMRMLNDCPSKNRYEEFMKKRSIWTRLCDKIYTDNFKEEYPELVKDLLKVSKQNVFNFIFVNRRRKVMDDGKENLDAIYKKSIEDALHNNEMLSSASVKSCNLLNCVISINGTDLEFENGKLLDSYDDEDDEEEDEEEEAYMKSLKILMNKETKAIRQKLNLVLSLNKNLSELGFCLDIPLMKMIAVYDNYEMEEFYQLMVRALQKLTNFKINYEPPYSDFPREHLSTDLTYKHYCQWLYSLEVMKYDPKMIPMSYQIKFEQYKDVEDIKKELKDVSLKLLSIGDKDEFYSMMTSLMSSSEAISRNDLTDLHSFIKYEEDRLKYIPENIINKENLANVINKLLLYCMSEPPLDFIIPKFNNVNDVLRLALVMSGNQASDLGKTARFKSFKNSERRLLMELLSHCKNRYEDILKYKNMWARFCERIHPVKFKDRYPDLVNDLQGSYSFLGSPENKKIRMEYRFYQNLFELDDRFKDYKDRAEKYIEELKKKREEEKRKELEQEKNSEDNTNSAANRLRQKFNTMRANSESNEFNKTLGTNNLFTMAEHQVLLRQFRCLENMPKEIKDYVRRYLLLTAGIAYNPSLLASINLQYINNANCHYYDGLKKKRVVKKGYEEVYEGLPDMLLEVYNGFMPTFNRKLLEKRIQELMPSILQLQEQNRQYKKDRQTYSSKWVELLNDKKIDKTVKLLSQKPGIYMRHLDELITKCQNEEEVNKVKTFFEKIAKKGSVKVLLSIKAYFQKRNKKLKTRAFLIKSNDNGKKSQKVRGNQRGKVKAQIKSSIYYTDKVKMPLKEDLCQQIIQICDHALRLKFEGKEKLNGVYIDPQLEKILVPFDLRNTSKSLENYTKGSRFDLSFKNITEKEKEEMIKATEAAIEKKKSDEMEVYSDKKKHEVDLLNLKSRIEKKRKAIESAATNGKTKSEIKQMKKDLDKDEKIRSRCSKELNKSTVKLSAIEKDLLNLQKDLEDKKQCPIGVSYKNIRLFTLGFSDMYLEVYDSDFNMKAFINIDEDYLNYQKEYNLYFGKEGSTVYADIDVEAILAKQGRYVMVTVGSGCSAQFGWMERDFVHSDEPFEPATVRQTIALNYTNEACPIVLDCQTHEFIWLDHPLAQNYYQSYVKCYHQYQRMLIHLKENADETHPDYPEERIEKITNHYKMYTALNANVKRSIFAYYLEPIRISIADLIRLHVEARGGTCIENEEELKEQDTIFLPYTPYIKKKDVHYVNCSHLETILSDYMK